MTNTKITFAALLSTLVGCSGPVWPDLAWEEFQTPVAVEDIELSQLDLADDDVTYFEIRDAYGNDGTCVSFNVRVVIGEKCAGASDLDACAEEFNSMTLDEIPLCSAETTGMMVSGMPPLNPLFTMLAINRGDRNNIVEYSAEALAAFLGPIDTEAEASLFMSSRGFNWNSGNLENGAIRAVEDGYEFITTRQSQYCFPMEWERVLWHLHADGEIEELRSQVSHSRDDCIMYAL